MSAPWSRWLAVAWGVPVVGVASPAFAEPGVRAAPSAPEVAPAELAPAEAPLPSPVVPGPGGRPADPDRGRFSHQMDLPTVAVEVALGALVLPGAEVCLERDTGACSQGDASLSLEAWGVFRLSRRFAFGGGVTWGLFPRQNVPRQDPPGVERSHTRGYFAFEGMARYYTDVTDSHQVWIGLTTGLGIVSDTFASQTDSETQVALVGAKGVNIRTEGFTLGGTIGGNFLIGERFLAGATLRYASWFLPETPRTDPFLDEASLTGHNVVLMGSVHVSYWSWL